MDKKLINKLIFSKAGIFVMLSLLVVVFVCVMEWGTSSNKGRQGIFSDNNSGKEAVRHFKEGEKLFKKGDDYMAMEEFLEAEKYCNNIKNELLKGGINWYKGELYYNRLDFTNALNMYNLSKESYLQCGRKEEVMRLYGKIAEIHLKNKNYEESILNYGKARAIAMELTEKERSLLKKGKTDSTLFKKYETQSLNYSTSLLSGYFGKESSVDETIKDIKEVYSRYNRGNDNPEDYLFMAYVYSYKGNTSIASKYIDKYVEWRYSPASPKGALSGIEKAGIYSLKSDIAKKENSYKLALEYKEKYFVIIDSIATVERTQSIRDIENAYWQKDLTLKNIQADQKSRYMIAIYTLILLIAILIIVVVAVSYKRRIERKNAEIESYMQSLKMMDEKLSSSEMGKARILQQLDVHKEKERHLKELLEGRFAEVRELVRTYYETGNSRMLQKKVEDLLKLKLSGDNFEVMEEVVNAKNDNIIKRMRDKYPQLKEDNVKLLNLVYAGFSAQEISVILNDTPQNIYVRKSRLKKMVSEMGDCIA